MRAPRQTEKRFVIGRQRRSKPDRRSTMVSSRRLGALPWSGRREFLKAAAAAAVGVACRPWPAGRAVDRRTVGRSGRDPPPHFPANLSCSRVRHHSIRCDPGSRRRRDSRLSRRHQRLSRRGRRPCHRPRRTIRHRSDRVAIECQPASREGRGGGVLAGSPRLPAGRVDAVRRRRTDELLAVHLRVRAGEHRHYGQRHARRSGRRRPLVAVADGGDQAWCVARPVVRHGKTGCPGRRARVRRRQLDATGIRATVPLPPSAHRGRDDSQFADVGTQPGALHATSPCAM